MRVAPCPGVLAIETAGSRCVNKQRGACRTTCEQVMIAEGRIHLTRVMLIHPGRNLREGKHQRGRDGARVVASKDMVSTVV